MDPAQWVESNTGHRLTDDEKRCIAVLAAIDRPYNLLLIDGGWSAAVCGTCKPDDEPVDGELAPRLASVEFRNGVTIRLRNLLATYDSADLTRLVLAAHEHAVRVEIGAVIYLATDEDATYDDGTHPTWPAACMEIRLSARQRDGSWYERHPSIDEAMETRRDEGT